MRGVKQGRSLSLLVVALYFGQGLPIGLALEAMPTALRAQGLSVQDLSWLSLALLPWAGKLLWARPCEQLCGRWGFSVVLIWTQMLQLLLCVGLAFGPPSAGLLPLLPLLLAMNLVAATQDNASNAWVALSFGGRTGAAKAVGLGGAGGLIVLGFMLGMVCGGGVLLQMLAAWGWLGLVLSMVVMQSLVLLALTRLKGQQGRGAEVVDQAEQGEQAVQRRALLAPLPWRELLWSSRLWLLMAMAGLVRMGATWQQWLLKPWWVDAGFGLAKAGQIQLLMQLSSGLAAGFAAAWCSRRWSVLRVSLVVLPLGVLGLICPWLLVQAHSVAESPADWQPWLWLVLGPGAWIDGLLMACATSCLLQWVSPQRPAFEMASSQAGEMVSASLVMALAPWVLSRLGYQDSMGVGVLLALAALPMLLLIGWCLKTPSAAGLAKAGATAATT